LYVIPRIAAYGNNNALPGLASLIGRYKSYGVVRQKTVIPH
jgi:hypothetical protein